MIDKRLNDKGKNWRHVFKVRKLGFFLPPYIKSYSFVLLGPDGFGLLFARWIRKRCFICQRECVRCQDVA